VLLPGGEPVRVRGVEVHGRQAEEAVAPRRVAVNLGAIDVGSVRRGVTMASPESLAVTRRVDVRLTLVPSAPALEHGVRVRVHQGTAEVLGRVSIGATRTPDGGWEAARTGETGVAVPAGGEAYVRLRLEGQAVLTRGDRLVLRSYSPPMTIAGGRVLDPEPPSGGIRRPNSLDRFRRMDGGAGVVEAWLVEQAGRGLGPEDLVRRGGLSPAEARRALEAAVAAGTAQMAGRRAFDAAFASGLAGAIERVVGAFHEREPIETGMPRDAVRQQTARDVRTELFDQVVGNLLGRGRLTGTDRLRLSSHRSAAAGAMAPAVEAVLSAVEAAGLCPPDEASLARAAELAPVDLRPLLSVLVRQGRLVRLETLYFHPERLARLKTEVRSAAAAAGTEVELDVAAFKDRHGLTRKFAIPLLEWLDRERVTRREGKRRVVLAD
jgi:selenocysteine-specific elongation factor